MKVAFLFSGQYRKIDSNIFRKSLSILTKRLDYDVYCYSWEEEGKSLNHGNKIETFNSSISAEKKIINLFEGFNLKKIDSENYKKFKNNLSTDYKYIYKSKSHKLGTINCLPQIYTLHKSYQLLLPFIDEYQLIFRCRLDSLFIHPLNIFPLEEIMESNYLYTLNFGRAFYPNRVYDIFFGGSVNSMSFLNNIWRDFPELIGNDYDNKLDRRDCCRVIFLSALTKNIRAKSLKTRICDIYRFNYNSQYEFYLLSSHICSLNLDSKSFKAIFYFFKWCIFRKTNLIKLLFIFFKTFLLIPLSYIKRIKYI
tara:strand:- start:7326 stop:8252 length:927 start_codon:yes stop_codon:yes gene_type:complete